MDYRELIKQHEGFRPYVYLDSGGVPTVGWGHAFFEEPKPKPGTIFTEGQCIEFFEDDMQKVEEDYVMVKRNYLDPKLSWVRRAVIKNMLFNLGISKFLGFKRMLAALRKEDYKTAAAEMLDSKWATQVKSRARTLARMMETGKWILS